jgi:hypothetical protein
MQAPIRDARAKPPVARHAVARLVGASSRSLRNSAARSAGLTPRIVGSTSEKRPARSPAASRNRFRVWGGDGAAGARSATNHDVAARADTTVARNPGLEPSSANLALRTVTRRCSSRGTQIRGSQAREGSNPSPGTKARSRPVERRRAQAARPFKQPQAAAAIVWTWANHWRTVLTCPSLVTGICVVWSRVPP